MSMKGLCFILLFVSIAIEKANSIPALSTTKLASEDVTFMALKVRSHLETRIFKFLSMYTPIAYRDRKFRGDIYYVKVLLGNDECVHLKIYEPELPKIPKAKTGHKMFVIPQHRPFLLEDYRTGLNISSPIRPFSLE